ADGRDEILTEYFSGCRGTTSSSVELLRREEGGTWRRIGMWSGADGGPFFGELDRDPARKEVLVGGGAYRLGDTGSSAVRFATIPEIVQPTLLDLDGDGHLDVLGVGSNPVGASNRLVLARNVCGKGPGTTTLFLPAFLSLMGAEATRFETEVAVTNFGASAISAVLRLHPADGASELDLASFTLEPGRVRLFSTTEDAGASAIGRDPPKASASGRPEPSPGSRKTPRTARIWPLRVPARTR
ncbi:MAG TPA: hypothetical protein VE129_01495, partial [Thermoanaerobaculia bacterium]|nr:hypothetical protein [Thermoanaerobaculia bacterium]